MLYLQLFCIIIAAYTTEFTLASGAGNNHGVYQICYENPTAEDSGHRICLSLMATAISSIMVCMVLMVLDVFIPCVDSMVKY